MNEMDYCPFCGHEVNEVFHTEDAYAHVICRNCGATGPSIAVFETEGSSRKEAIRKWNERKTLVP